MIGQALSHFRITAKLGEGGMGEVYRAEDTSLGREVAVKVLPEAFVADPERLARFEREAKLLASLNHPNIASIYEIGVEGSTHFLAMELAHGEDLATRLQRGAVPIEEAVPIALQVAEALEAAHDRGIVHRDLKPANVMVAPDGAVKVLDFGLAKAWEEGEGASADLTASPTLTAQMTQAGVILGTAAYMAPEQARGQEADRRADIWSFGVVLYEMLVGERLFRADTVSDTLARVLMAETDWEAIGGRVPRPVATLLRRCLDRDLRQRLQSIGEARITLEAYLQNPTGTEDETPESRSKNDRAGWAGIAAAFLAGVLITAAVWLLAPDAAPEPPEAIHASLLTPPGVDFLMGGPKALALSPDGKTLAFAGWKDNRADLYLRALDRFDTRLVAETENASNPFFSPDGRWLAYEKDRKLWKVPVEGGTPYPLATVQRQVWGADWSSEGSIVFNRLFTGLWRIPEQGGEPERLAAPDPERGEIDLEFPDVLPDGKAVVYTAFKGLLPDSAEIGLLDLETGERTTLIENASGAQYLPTGHLIFGRSAGVFLAPFDAGRRELTGAAVPAPDGIHYDRDMGIPRHATADSGEIVFLPGTGDEQRRLVSVDFEGGISSLFESLGAFMYPRFAPDGRSLVVTKYDHTGSHLWIANLSTGALTRLTRDGSNMFPVVHPSGDRVAFYSDRESGRGIYWIATDGSGPAELLIRLEEISGEISPHDWTPDGSSLVYSVDEGTENERVAVIKAVEMATGDVTELAREACCASVSPNGRWLAYMGSMDREADSQVFVGSMTGEGGRQQVSTNGGGDPYWSSDGRELYYANGSRMMAVAVDTSDGLVPSAPRPLFEGEFAIGTYVISPNFDVAPDGSGFVMIEDDRRGNRAHEARLIHGWLDTIRRLVPD